MREIKEHNNESHRAESREERGEIREQSKNGREQRADRSIL
jgi:hypothetical protein